PTVKLNGIAGFQSADAWMLFDWPSRLWAVGPSVSMPLFQGGQLAANLRQAKATHQEAVARYRQSVLAAFADVENSLAAEQLLTDQYKRVMAALDAAPRQLEIANNRYSSGLLTYLEVAPAQNAALGLERSGARLRGQQLVAVVALIKSLGGGWKEREVSR
ncbi:MAG: TolC family protein, partial [Deltaproteobacteria bacterium]|nr:TolC family protein [Deltaproteobacteria bacterium]